MSALRASGPYGQIEFDGRLVKITRDGWRASGPARSFEAADLTDVRLKRATSLTNGHLQFGIPGVKTSLLDSELNRVLFTKKNNSEFEALAAAIEEFLEARGPLSEARVAELAAIYAAGEEEANAENRAASEAKLDALMRKSAGAIYDGHIVDYKGYRHGFGIKRPIAGATAEFESGADRTRPTLTRIGAGAILAGPVGAIAGGMFKKDKTKGYVTIVFPDGASVIIEGPAKDEKKMRAFAQGVNMIAEAEQRREGGPATPEQAAETSNADPTDQLLKLKQLLDAGVLDQAQYEEKAAPLLAQL